MSQAEPGATRKGPRLIILLLPLAVFVALAGVFLLRLESGDDPSTIPSALIGKPAPQFDLPPLAGLKVDGGPVPGIKRADLDGKVTLVNVFASWCGPCREEHAQLEALAKDKRIRLVAINYKDQPENALRFLGQFGNPYEAVGVDEKGRIAIDWGVYGVPETFVVGRDGIIRYKFIGPILPRSLDNTLRPEIEKALAAGG